MTAAVHHGVGAADLANSTGAAITSARTRDAGSSSNSSSIDVVATVPPTLSPSSGPALWHHAQLLASAVAGSSVGWALRSLNYGVSDAVSTYAVSKNGGASISGAAVVFEASETLGSSSTLQHHARMLAIAVSQRAA